MILPVSTIWKLQTKRHKKIGVFGIFAVGVLVIIVAGLRVPLQHGLNDYGDVTYNYAPVFLVSNIELIASYFCATAPALSMLTRRFRGKVQKTRTSTKMQTTVHSVTAPRKTGNEYGPGYRKSDLIDMDNPDTEAKIYLTTVIDVRADSAAKDIEKELI